ncbi:hypothetical protein FRC11_010983, partial [Ceratobasidium sp. 423]
MGTNSFRILSVLLALIFIIAALEALNNPYFELGSQQPRPNRRFQSYFEAIKSLHNCYALQECLEDNRVAYLNYRLNIVLCVVSIIAVIGVFGSILFPFSGDRASPEAGDTTVRTRGRYNSISVAPQSVG